MLHAVLCLGAWSMFFFSVIPVLNGTGEQRKPVFSGKFSYSPGDLEPRESRLQVPVFNGTCLKRKKCRSVIDRFHWNLLIVFWFLCPTWLVRWKVTAIKMAIKETSNRFNYIYMISLIMDRMEQIHFALVALCETWIMLVGIRCMCIACYRTWKNASFKTGSSKRNSS